MQRSMAINSANFTLNRLYSLQFLSGFCFIIAGLLMVEQYWELIKPFIVKDLESYYLYMRAVINNWVVLLLIGGLIQIYTTHRIASITQNID